MKDTEDHQVYPTQPSSPWDKDLEDTVPPTLVSGDLRAKLAETSRRTEPADATGYRLPDEETLRGQDRIVTPTPFPTVSEAERAPSRDQPRASCAMRGVVGLCLIISVASLALTGFLIYSLMNVRNTATQGVEAAIQAVDSFGGAGFHYEYQFQRDIPFSGDIPFQQDIMFPFEGDIPINTTVEVPINIGLQTIVVKVPINTSVYVNTSVPVHVSQTFHVSTTIPVSMTIPIDVEPDDPAVQALLGRIREWLVKLREAF